MSTARTSEAVSGSTSGRRTRRRVHQSGDGRDTGSATLELAALTPALLAPLLAILAAARITGAGQQVDGAAREAARAASLQATAAAGQQAARAAATAFLRTGDLTCRSMTVQVSGGWNAPARSPAAVRVQVACTVDLADLALPALPGSRTMKAGYTAVLDTYTTRTAP